MNLGAKIGMVTALLASACLSASGAELATLRNGFAIRHERHEVLGDVTRLYMATTPDNYVDIPTVEILNYEEILAPVVPVPDPIQVQVASPTLDDMVNAASNHNHIDPDLIVCVIRAESGFNPRAISRKGAQGLMQLMPQTAARLGVQDAFDPATNVEGGTRYLGQLLSRYHNNVALALAAYNAGPERVEQYRGVPRTVRHEFTSLELSWILIARSPLSEACNLILYAASQRAGHLRPQCPARTPGPTLPEAPEAIQFKLKRVRKASSGLANE